MASDYPPGWPACPGCDRPVLDGKATCGDGACGPVWTDQGRFNPRRCDVTGEPCRNILCIQHEGCFRANSSSVELEPSHPMASHRTLAKIHDGKLWLEHQAWIDGSWHEDHSLEIDEKQARWLERLLAARFQGRP